MVNQKENAAGGSKKKKGPPAAGSAGKQSAPPQQQNQQKKVPPPAQPQQENKPQCNQQNVPTEPKITEKSEAQSATPPIAKPPAAAPSSEPMTQPAASSATAASAGSTAKPNEEGKSKKELQAERRAKQEADRARKEQAKLGKGGGGAASAASTTKPSETTAVKPKDLTTSSDAARKSAASAANANDVRATPIREMRRMSLLDSPSQGSAIHPAFIALKARCESREIVDLDAICIEFVAAFKQFILSYNKPSDKAMSRDVDALIKPQLSYITGGLPLPLAIGNLVKQLKQEINALSDDCTEEKGKQQLTDWLDEFVENRIQLAFQAISLFTRDKLKGAHVVLTYSWCPLVEQTLLAAHEDGVNFHVCVLDSYPCQRGKKLLNSLCKADISCSYGLITSVSHLIKQCRLVLLGCSAILSNGYALAIRGSSQVAMVAQAANIPVLLAAPTYKFVDKVQTFTEGHRSSCTALVSERMEMIPADLITAVVTELRILPPSSAPAVLRAKQLVV